MPILSHNPSLGQFQVQVEAALADMATRRLLERIWKKDYRAWKPIPVEIDNRLGWLTVAEQMQERGKQGQHETDSGTGSARGTFACDRAQQHVGRIMRAGRTGRLRCRVVLSPTVGKDRHGAEGLSKTHDHALSNRHHRRVWASIPAFDGTIAQGRTKPRSVSRIGGITIARSENSRGILYFWYLGASAGCG